VNIQELFNSVYGVSPDLVAEAPGRVNLIGEHIDYSQGFVLPFAIKDRTFAALRKRDDRLIKIASAQRKSEIHTISLMKFVYQPNVGGKIT